MNTQIIAIANQKGGVGKTTTCANLGIGLAQTGKKVLLIDGDPQGSLTISLGHPQPDKLPFTLSDAMGRILMDEPMRPGEGILHHPEGVDLMPADIQLSGMEVSLVNAMSRETILRQYLDTLKGQYSHILIDCQPSLGMLTVNALASANLSLIHICRAFRGGRAVPSGAGAVGGHLAGLGVGRGVAVLRFGGAALHCKDDGHYNGHQNHQHQNGEQGRAVFFPFAPCLDGPAADVQILLFLAGRRPGSPYRPVLGTVPGVPGGAGTVVRVIVGFPRGIAPGGRGIARVPGGAAPGRGIPGRCCPPGGVVVCHVNHPFSKSVIRIR